MSRELFARKVAKRQIRLKDHRQHGKVLVPPLAPSDTWVIERDGVLPLSEWIDDFLPEHLWLANLVMTGSLNEAAKRFNWTCDKMDKLIPSDSDVFMGYISDFALVPVESYVAANDAFGGSVAEYAGLDRRFKSVLALYPRCPASWIAGPPGAEKEPEALAKLTELITTLRSIESPLVLRCRIIGLNRLLAHGKLFFDSDHIQPELIDDMAAYPMDDSKANERVEQFVRIISNIQFRLRSYEGWATHFWSINAVKRDCSI